MKKTNNNIGGIYRVGKTWTLEFPSPQGVVHNLPTLKAAREAAKKAKLTPKRWAGCDCDA